MVKAKNIQTIIIILLCLWVTAESQIITWTNFTSFDDVQNLSIFDDTLYVTTSGGLIEILDKNSFTTYNNISGLGSNNISSIIKDANNQKWITAFGRLTKFSLTDSENFLFKDNDENLFMLNRIRDENEHLWIGSSIGLILFSKIDDGGQINDSYQLFGDLNPNPSVNDLYLSGDTIWIATSDGLAFGDKSNVDYLKSPSNWTTFSMSNYPVLESNEFFNIVSYQSALYASNVRGVFKIELDSFGAATITKLPLPANILVNQIQVSNDSMFVCYTSSGTGYIDYVSNDINSFVVNLGNIDPIGCMLFDNELWIGTANSGLYTYSAANGLEPYFVSGLPDNDVSDITVDKFGKLYAGFSDETYALGQNNSWSNFNFYVGQDATVAMLDSLERIWMATWGNGVWLYDSDTIINYDENNSTLRGNSDGAFWVYITGMDNDGRYLYFTSYRAVNNYPIAIADMQNLDSPLGWDSIGIVNGLSTTFLTSLDHDGGRVVVGTESDGVYECFVGEDPFNSSKLCRHLTKENSLLLANTVRAVKYAPDGELWVGTNFGLSRYDPGIDFFRDVVLPSELNSDITALEFDSRGNLWIGTPDGLALRHHNSGGVEIFTTLNSGLVANNIKNITFDPFTGEVYVVTDGGISKISSLVGKPVFDIDESIAFPNPFIIDDSDDNLSFNFGIAGTVSIFTVVGELIKTTTVNQGWDGTNDNGSDVSSGIYLYLIEDSDGNTGKGKILLVRN